MVSLLPTMVKIDHAAHLTIENLILEGSRETSSGTSSSG